MWSLEADKKNIVREHYAWSLGYLWSDNYIFFYFFYSFYLNIFHIVSKSTEAYHHGITIIITIFISFYSGSHTNTHNLNNAHELSWEHQVEPADILF